MVQGSTESYDSPWQAARAQGRVVPDAVSVADMLFYPLLPSDQTRSLLAGVRRISDQAIEAGKPHSQRGQHCSSLAELIEQLGCAVHGAVAAAVRGRSRVGVLATGGLDSAVVAAVAKAVMGEPPVLVCIRGGISSTTELMLQDLLASTLGSEVISLSRIPDFSLEPLLRLNRSSDFPAGGMFTHVWDRAAALAADRGVDLLLTGEGGNEVFSSSIALAYDHVVAHRFVEAMWTIGRLRDSDQPWHHFSRRRVWRRFLGTTGRDSPDLAVWRGRYADAEHETAVRRADQISTLRREGWTYSEIDARLWVERCELYSAADSSQGIDFASPLTAPSVLDAVSSVPVEWRNPVRVGCQDKFLLRLLGRPHLPPEITETRKCGVSNQLAVVFGDADLRPALERLTPAATWLGVTLNDRFAVPGLLPAELGLDWTRLLAFCAWADNAVR